MSEWGLVVLFTGITVIATAVIIYPLRQNRVASLLLTTVIFLVVGLAYAHWGSFSEWRHALHRIEAHDRAQKILQSIKSPRELIELLRAKLDDTPSSAKGWYLLGRVLMSQNEQKNAVNAFAKAYYFYPNNKQYALNYAHSLWILNNRQCTEQIKQIVQSIPNRPDAFRIC